MCREIYPGQIYRHFKDKLYQIVTIAIHSETGEKLVIYQQLYGEFKVYARPYDMFLSEVDLEKYPDSEQKYRFEKVVEMSKSVNVSEDAKNTTFNDVNNDGINPYLISFLEAETYEEKREILISSREKMTDRLIDDIAAAMDISVAEGDIEDRFISLLNCVSTLSKYEVNRFR